MSTFSRPRWWWVVLAVGVFAWLLFIAIDMLRRFDQRDGTFPFLSYWRFNADADRGFAESTGYLFVLVAAGALIYAWRWSRRRSVFAALAAIFLAIVVDDSLEVHERGGHAISSSLGWEPLMGVRAQDLGELTVWALIAAPLGLIFCIAWYFSDRDARRGALKVVACLAVMLFFATVIDVLGPASGPGGLDWHYRLRYALRLFEYSGEFLSMVAACLVSLRLAAAARRESLYPGDHGVPDPAVPR